MRWQYLADELDKVVKELSEVSDWFCFRGCLGVPHSKLLAIRKNYLKHGPKRCMLEMLLFWMNQEPPMWAKIVQALLRMEMNTIAQKSMVGIY